VPLPADDVSLTPELFNVLGEDRSTREWGMILEMRDRLKENRLAGEGIEKKKIPRYYRDMA
jgi:hypothetical protein